MPRATKPTYITTLNGDIAVPFQFAPHELNGAESGNFSERVRIGGHTPELIWISGQVRRLNVPFFIDRTTESIGQRRANPRQFDPLIRFQRSNPKIRPGDAEAYRLGTQNANGGAEEDAGKFVQTDFDPNPNFRQFPDDAGRGVYLDLDLFLHFVRPSGKGITEAKFNSVGEFNILDDQEARFVPPPVCRFFHGNYWLQGYLSRIEYKMSALNALMVPRRLEGTLEFLIEKDGVLIDI